MPDRLTRRLHDVARRRLQRAKGSHGFDHVERVVRLADRIARAEQADRRIVRMAAILHDIAREEEDRSKGKKCHAELGARMTTGILAREGIAAEEIERVAEAIRAHRFRRGPRPKSLEARVLHDADKLDCIGAVGIARAYVFAGEVGALTHTDTATPEKDPAYGKGDTGYREYRVKLRKLKSRMLTRTGKRIAAGRDRFMRAYFDRLLSEVGGRS